MSEPRPPKPGPDRLVRRALLLGAASISVATACLAWWATNLAGLPDPGDPFDVAAFQRTIPEGSNAFVLYTQAAAILPPAPPEPTADWDRAGPAERQWLQSSRRALELWRKGTERPDALNIPPGDFTFETRVDVALALRGSFAKLALLEGSRLEAAGRSDDALRWYLALLRSSRHCGRRGSFVERLYGVAMHNLCIARLSRWASDARVDAAMLRRALDATYAAEAATPPTSDGLKLEYLGLLHSLSDPDLMLKMHGAYVTPTPEGGSVTHYEPVGWRSSPTRIGRVIRKEPERSRRVIRSIFANWLGQCDVPPDRRPPRVKPDPGATKDPDALSLMGELFMTEGPEAAGTLPPERIAYWYGTTMDAKLVMPNFSGVESAVAGERTRRAGLLVTLGNELYKRDHGGYPGRVEDLVGPYLKSLPAGYSSK